jgi:hypothetical protein
MTTIILTTIGLITAAIGTTVTIVYAADLVPNAEDQAATISEASRHAEHQLQELTRQMEQQ